MHATALFVAVMEDGTSPTHGQLLSLEAEVNMWWAMTTPGSTHRDPGHQGSSMRQDTYAREKAIEWGGGDSSVPKASMVSAP